MDVKPPCLFKPGVYSGNDGILHSSYFNWCELVLDPMSISSSNPPSTNRPSKKTYGKSYKHGHVFLENNFDTLMSQFSKGHKRDGLTQDKSTSDEKPCRSTSHQVLPTNNTRESSNSPPAAQVHPAKPLSKQNKSVSLPAMKSSNPFGIKSSDTLSTTAKVSLAHSRHPKVNVFKPQSTPADLFGFPESSSDSDGAPVPVTEQLSLFRKKRNRVDRHSLSTHLEVDLESSPPKQKSPRQEKNKTPAKQSKPRPRPPDTSKSPHKRAIAEPTEIYDVKQPHQCRELGQQQMFRDEVQYLLDCIKQTQPLSTRCLALCSLASECLSPHFRRQLSFHQLIAQLTSSLSDSPSAPPPLRLAAASLLYALSRDRSSTELDSHTLLILLQLTTDYTHEATPVLQPAEDAVKEFELNRAIKTTSSRVSDLLASLEQTETHPLPPKGPISHQLLAAMALQSLISLQKEDFSQLLSEKGGVEAVNALILSSLQASERALEARTNGKTENNGHRSRFNKFKHSQIGDSTHSPESKYQMHLFLLSNSLLSLNSLTKKHPASLVQLATTTPHLPHVLFSCFRVNRQCLELDTSCQVAYECLKQAMTSVTELCNEVDEFSQLIAESAEYLTSLVDCVLTLAPRFEKECQFDIQIIGLMALVNHLAKSNTCETFLQLVSQDEEVIFDKFVKLYAVKQKEAESLTKELSQVISRIKLANSPHKKQLNLSAMKSDTDSNESFGSSSPHLSRLSMRDQSPLSHSLKISLPIEYFRDKLVPEHPAGRTQVLDIPDRSQNPEAEDLSMSVKEMSDFIREAATSEEVKGKAEANFESSILAAMASLLVGLVASKNATAQSLLSQRLRVEDFEKMATLLHQMLSFYNLVCDSPVAREKTTQLATDVLRFFTSYL